MRVFLILLLLTFEYCVAGATVGVRRDADIQQAAAVGVGKSISLLRRALPDSPTSAYVPGAVDCPLERPTIRSASSLSANETAWLPMRRNKTVAPMIAFLSRANISGFDAPTYISNVANNASALPNIGIAVSGGGYRALMNGAGFIAAADDRTPNSTSTGHIGGLLQSATYLTGLSGGGWLVGSLYSNNFSTVVQLRDGSDGSAVWQFGNSVFLGPVKNGLSIANTADYWINIGSQVRAKDSAGYDTSLTDYWGRALSYQLINATDGGPAYTFSSVAEEQNFISGDWPFPILVADGRAPGIKIISLNSTVYEFNPFELGSWDPTTYGFAPLRYIGSNFSSGALPDGELCIRGFDNAGFVMGTSSTLFNQFLIQVNQTNLPSVVVDALRKILTDIGEDNNDIAQYHPNPFYGFNKATSQIADTAQLTLVDGGEDLQNLPLNPLIQPLRAVDVIFAVDSSADTTYFWPNGTSLVATYERSLNGSIENGTSFPAIPDQTTFVNLGLNSRPTFFGCDVSNTTHPAPLIVYIPNGPYITYSNVSTYDLSHDNAQRNLIIENGYDVATLGNGTFDRHWPTCVACAVLSRSFHKTGTSVPSDCSNCFTRYCWNGTTNMTTPSSDYAPTYQLGNAAATSNSFKADSRRPRYALAILTTGVGLLLSI